ncbi:hypothetical protein [Streptomyces fragilis]|uniref:hypothetical protein n=1 Tax=Streptomyces fragilis TaxID=67301 RepID=UPI0024DE2629|nr:hypothetical protein [Streptomyces fragilis]
MATETIAPGSASAEAVEPSTAPTADESPGIGHRIERFNHTGAVQKFIVPPGVTKIDARCWGGGGKDRRGGGGGFAAGDIAVQPGETLLVVVDMGGGVGGGGMSGLYSQRLGQPLLIAGGGGEGWNHVAGGAGGGTHGSDGTAETKDRNWTAAKGASGTIGGDGAVHRDVKAFGGPGGSTGENGNPGFPLRYAGEVPIPGMGGGGGGGDAAGGGGWAGGGGGLAIGTRFLCGGAGGSSFVEGPGVTNGRTLAGAGTQAGGKGDPFYQTGIGDAKGRGQVVLQWTDLTLTVTQGGPPDEPVTQGGDKAAYPGVRVASTAALGPLTVTVTLPPDRHLLWGTQAQADYQLTVQHPDKTQVPYPGVLSGDGGSLTFTDVHLRLPGTTIMWVAVSADHDSPIGSAHLTFDVSGKTSPSTRIVVNPAFTVSPSGDPVILQRGGGCLLYTSRCV